MNQKDIEDLSKHVEKNRTVFNPNNFTQRPIRTLYDTELEEQEDERPEIEEQEVEEQKTEEPEIEEQETEEQKTEEPKMEGQEIGEQETEGSEMAEQEGEEPKIEEQEDLYEYMDKNRTTFDVSILQQRPVRTLDDTELFEEREVEEPKVEEPETEEQEAEEQKTEEPKMEEQEVEEQETEEPEMEEVENLKPNYVKLPEVEELEVEGPNKSEKRIMSLQDKLQSLKEKIQKNPPKTILGKRLAKARLDRLSNMIERKIYMNNIKVLSENKRMENDADYCRAQEKLLAEKSNLYYELESIIYEEGELKDKIKRLRSFNPQSINFKELSAEQKEIQKKRPKGYKSEEKDNTDTVSLFDEKAKQLEAQLRKKEEEQIKIEEKIKDVTDRFGFNKIIYEEGNNKIQEDLQNDLATLKNGLATRKPNIFKSISAFVSKKIQQFKDWRAERKAKATEKADKGLDDALNKIGERKEIFLQSNAGGISKEDQRKFSEEFQKKFGAETKQEKNEKEEEIR